MQQEITEKTVHPAIKPATEFGPIIAFFVVYTLYGLESATAAIMITTVIALAVAYWLTRKIPTMPLVTAVIVLIFGGLTLYLHDETFIKMKPTIIYTLFALALVAGLVLGKSFIKTLFGNVWKINEAGWKKLTLRLAGFFILMALANEFVWRSFSTDIWVNIKVFGFTAATFVFFLAQVPLIARHGLEEEEPEQIEK